MFTNLNIPEITEIKLQNISIPEGFLMSLLPKVMSFYLFHHTFWWWFAPVSFKKTFSQKIVPGK